MHVRQLVPGPVRRPPRHSANFGIFGGLNVADPPDELMERSHIFADGRWVHRSGPLGRIPVESPNLQNIDFLDNELGQRKGSAVLADLTVTGLNVLLSGDVLVRGKQYKSPVTNSRVQLAVSKLTIYTDQSGAWAQIKNASSIAYTHSDQTVTKCSFTEHDGHLDIGLDGNNAIQLYRTGADLDDQLNNNTTTTTVDATSASGQKVLNVAVTTIFLVNDRVAIGPPSATTTVDVNSNSGQKVLSVAATTMFTAGDTVIINKDGAREETGVIDTIQAGVSITLIVNLTFTHTAAQADVVAVQTGTRDEIGYVASIQGGVSITLQVNLTNAHDGNQADLVAVQNQYTQAFGGAKQAVTGAWNTGYFMVEGSHGHLAFCKGDTVVEFTAVNAVYDRVNGGFYQTRSAVSGMKAFTPEFASELREVIFLFTEIGFEYFGGFEIYDLLEKIDAPAPMNHQCIVATEKWLMYLTAQGGVAATDGRSVIDVGRRFKAGDSNKGPLDNINLTNSAIIAFGFYDEAKKQAQWGIATGGTAVVDTFIVLDMQLGEPIPGEPRESFESHVRPLKWTGLNYVSIWQTQGTIVAARSTGFLYTLKSGIDDFGTAAIDGRWFSPVFNAGFPVREKGWLKIFMRAISKGNFPVFINYYKDRSNAPSAQFSFNQGTAAAVYGTAVYGPSKYSTSQLVKGSDDISLVSDTIQFEIFNELAGESFVITDMEVRHEILAEQL